MKILMQNLCEVFDFNSKRIRILLSIYDGEPSMAAVVYMASNSFKIMGKYKDEARAKEVTNDKLIAEIRRMYGELIGKRGARNGGAKFFFESTYENRGKRYPMFLMTRDGFSLLVMGFTGKNALEWKLQYIRAFNQMESFIREKSTQMWIETRKAGKFTRKAETDTIQKLVE